MPIKPVRQWSSVVVTFALIITTFATVQTVLTRGSFDSRSSAAETSGSSEFFPMTSGDIANQDRNSLDLSGGTKWLGTASSASGSYLGIRFVGQPLPPGSKVTSASVSFVPPANAWISLKASIYAEVSANPVPFSLSSGVSTRALTVGKKNISDNVEWKANTRYSYDVTGPVNELLLSGKNSGVISLVVKGGGAAYGRKNIYGYTNTAYRPKLTINYTVSSGSSVVTPTMAVIPTIEVVPTSPPVAPTSGIPTSVPPTAPPVEPTMPPMTSGESMSMMAWRVGGKNSPNPAYDKCDDGTDVVAAHNAYYVIAYDGVKYPTWHPPVVTNPITGNGKCYFGHEHGSDPQGYTHWNEIVQHFGKDQNGDGAITAMTITSEGRITDGDRAGIPFGIANEHMNTYYNQEGRDSIFVRHEDHVGHKIEFVNNESQMVGNTTHTMSQLAGTQGINVPYYTTGSETYKATGVVCTHLHKFHQGTHAADAIRNNLHEVIFHSTCTSVDVDGINAPAYYPGNTVVLTGMMSFGNPGEYKRFCFADRSTKVCPDGKNADGSCVINDPLISKLPPAIYSQTLGRNMVDRYCLDNWLTLNPDPNVNKYFAPYELWEGDLRIQKADGDMLAEHGRQWDVLDPIRFVDPNSATGFSYNAANCAKPGGAYDQLVYVGGCSSRTSNVAWDSPQSGFRGLKRTTYFGRNRVSNPGGAQVWWTDPLGGNAVNTPFASGLKQRISSVEADIQRVQYRIQQLKGSNNFLNDRAIQRLFNSGGNTVHAPN